ncbi:MAG: large conductance mechanosensitive channel protein MscL [Acholeplasmataceae bacterium]|jgi:large conductance mechanosensitive channel
MADKKKKDKKSFFQGFKDFISRGSVLDMAVAVIIGGAFGAIVTSMVNDILMPSIAAIFGKASFENLFAVVKGTSDYSTLTYADAVTLAATEGATIIAYGRFIQAIVNFLIIAFFLYVVIIVVIKGAQKRLEERRLAAEAEEKAKEDEAPKEPEIPEDIKLLTEIRDQLKDLKKGK